MAIAIGAGAGVKLNVGCGVYLSAGWINIDSDPATPADVHYQVPPIPYDDNTVDEIAAVHFLEHLAHDEALEFLSECHRVLKPGRKLGIVVPDTYAICRAYVNRTGATVEYPYEVIRTTDDLDTVCDLFFYSTVQASPHKWSWDLHTLYRALMGAGFSVTGEIDRYDDPRLGTGQWYQCGLDSVKLIVPASSATMGKLPPFTNEKAQTTELVNA